jgi:hypothetical protein
VRLRPLGRDSASTLVVWGTAVVVYITIGVFFVDLMLSVFVAMGYLLIVAWLVPAAIRRLR